MRAESLFPDGLDSVEVDGVRVRKGSIAAFIYNALASTASTPARRATTRRQRRSAS